MKLVFEQDILCNKVVYAVSKLPLLHITAHSIVDLDCPDVKKSTRMQKILQLPENNSSGFLKSSNLPERNLLKMTMSFLLINVMA